MKALEKLTHYRNMSVRILPTVRMADGTEMSVQASASHYCSPRVTHRGRYTHVEVGFPTFKPPRSWRKYGDECVSWGDIWWLVKQGRFRSAIRMALKKDHSSIYAYIPVELVQREIERRGGMIT